jgi:hypothetical protein
MPIQISWRVPEKLIYAKLYGDCCEGTFIEYFDTLNNFLNQVSKPVSVHILMDMLEITSSPKPAFLIAKAARQFITNPNAFYGIHVTQNRIVHFVGNLVAQTARIRYRSYTTVDEGMQFLCTIDPSICGA